MYLFLRYKCIISSSNNSRSSLVFFAYSTITTININSAGQGIKIRRKTRRASFLFDRSWFIWKKDIKFFARLEFLFTHYSVEICVLRHGGQRKGQKFAYLKFKMASGKSTCNFMIWWQMKLNFICVQESVCQRWAVTLSSFTPNIPELVHLT